MMELKKRNKITIDATGMTIGRLASKISAALIGKNSVNFMPHIDAGDKVVVLCVDQARFSGNKLETKLYRHHSNHPGGLKEKKAKDLMVADPKKLVQLAVSKMLPKNKMRTARLLRLSFK